LTLAGTLSSDVSAFAFYDLTFSSAVIELLRRGIFASLGQILSRDDLKLNLCEEVHASQTLAVYFRFQYPTPRNCKKLHTRSRCLRSLFRFISLENSTDFYEDLPDIGCVFN
jgi:hypothetical protein